jgi:DNA-directed RNA polymerase specialized sigma24 family protein
VATLGVALSPPPDAGDSATNKATPGLPAEPKLGRKNMVEERARTAWSEGDFQAAATIALEGYGPEIRSFLLAKFRGDEYSSDNVYGDFALDLWRGLPRFRWQVSLQAWCYRLARHASIRFWRSPQNRPSVRDPLSQAPLPEDLIERTGVRTLHVAQLSDEFTRLRERLNPDDKDLLILRVDRELSWPDIAHALLEPGNDPDDVWLKKREAALRQRFADVKRRLKRLARDAGLSEELVETNPRRTGREH